MRVTGLLFCVLFTAAVVASAQEKSAPRQFALQAESSAILEAVQS